MKLLRKLVIVLTVVTCILGSFLSVQAADDQLGTMVDGSVLTDKSEVTGNTLPLARGTYLAYGSATLTDKGSKVLNVSGFTSCNQTCNQVKVTLHLQRLVKGTWTTVTTLDTKTAYNTNYVSNSKNVTVTGGYYYRIAGSHVAVKGKVTESTSSATDGMWVSK